MLSYAAVVSVNFIHKKLPIEIMLMKKYSLSHLACTVGLMLVIVACKKSHNDPAPAPPSGSNTPAITGISPDHGPKNTAVVIAGNNFGSDVTKVKVFFNSVQASIQSVSNASITAIVPAKANNGKVTVVIDTATAVGPLFTYEPTVTVTTLAGGNRIGGHADGTGSAAKLYGPVGIAVDKKGNVYVGDVQTYCIRKITPEGVVTTLTGNPANQGYADGTAAAALFLTPRDLIVDTVNNILYIAEWATNRVRRVKLDGLQDADAVATYAGGGPTVGFKDGPKGTALFHAPNAVAVDATGNVYVIDEVNYRIRKILPDGFVSTLAGTDKSGAADGTATSATIGDQPAAGIAVDANGVLYFSDKYNYTTIRKLANGTVSTIAGQKGDYIGFSGIALDKNGNIIVADEVRNCILSINPSGDISVIAGTPGEEGLVDGPPDKARFDTPEDVAVDRQGNIYVSDTGNNAIRKITVE